ncbi:hypothetical protein PIB30_098739 [Stylosanthes scabra]|uniref:Uncharacterized protein n=1 Tax=Stylosanthes scabra TaxID=79078 RepID=A0ABU6UW54_9FABA|nr:hypothetical protein [Stylosanthes scabra]
MEVGDEVEERVNSADDGLVLGGWLEASVTERERDEEGSSVVDGDVALTKKDGRICLDGEVLLAVKVDEEEGCGYGGREWWWRLRSVVGVEEEEASWWLWWWFRGVEGDGEVARNGGWFGGWCHGGGSKVRIGGLVMGFEGEGGRRRRCGERWTRQVRWGVRWLLEEWIWPKVMAMEDGGVDVNEDGGWQC